jgi:hypothetical protein
VVSARSRLVRSSFASPALIYQHATRERDRKIADGLNEQIKTARRAPVTNPAVRADEHATGTGSASGA